MKLIDKQKYEIGLKKLKEKFNNQTVEIGRTIYFSYNNYKNDTFVGMSFMSINLNPDSIINFFKEYDFNKVLAYFISSSTSINLDE